jgi:hypothetical protein
MPDPIPYPNNRNPTTPPRDQLDQQLHHQADGRPDLTLVPRLPPADGPTTPIESPLVHVGRASVDAFMNTGADAYDEDPDADDEAEPVTPQAPLDVRVLEMLSDFFQARPRWSERPPSTAEAWEYALRGDWTTNEHSARRVLHSVCVVIAFVVTYPIEWLIHIARQKPTGCLLIAVVLFVLSHIL